MPILRWRDAAGDTSLEILKEQYLDELAGSGRSEHTTENFSRIIARYIRFLKESGERAVGDDLCVETVTAYRIHLVKSGMKMSSAKTHLQAIKAWASFLTGRGLYSTNPLASPNLLPKVPKALPKYLTEDERAIILDALREPTASNVRDKAIVCLGLDTGARVNEMAQITLGDIDFKNCEVKLKGKGGKERQVGFGRTTASWLKLYVTSYRRRVEDPAISDGRLFLCHTGHGKDGRNSIGEPLSRHGIQQVFDRISNRTGIHVTPHMLRHTFAHDFLANGGSVADLATLLGHGSEQQALWYAKVFNFEAVNRQKNNSVVDRQMQKRRGRA